MTDSELIEILERPVSNLEKALAIRTALKASTPSALNVKPDKQRKKRQVKIPPPPSDPTVHNTYAKEDLL